MDSFKDVLEAAQAYCKTQMAEPTYNLYIDGLEPISLRIPATSPFRCATTSSARSSPTATWAC